MKNLIILFVFFLMLPQNIIATNAIPSANTQENMKKRQSKVKAEKIKRVKKWKKYKQIKRSIKQKFKFHWGGFLLGFLLTIYGIIIAWIWASSEKNKNIIKSAWLGLSISLAFLLLIFLVLYFLSIGVIA